MGLENNQKNWDKRHEYQTTTLLNKYCNRHLLCAGRCARCWEYRGDYDRLCFKGSNRAVKNNLGVRETGVERFGTETSCILCKKVEFLSVSPN